jgi:hypothetical protein
MIYFYNFLSNTFLENKATEHGISALMTMRDWLQLQLLLKLPMKMTVMTDNVILVIIVNGFEIYSILLSQ